MPEKQLLCKNWNFDLEKPIGLYKSIKNIKKNSQYFIVIFNEKDQIQKIEHRLKTSFFKKKIESFTYEYKDDLLMKRTCFDRFSDAQWYNVYSYNEINQLDRVDTFVKKEKDFELLNYSLFYFDGKGFKNLRKVMDAEGNLSSYEVFHYEDGEFQKKEMFNHDNEKLVTEMYNYNSEGKLIQIDFFDPNGNHDRSVKMEVPI